MLKDKNKQLAWKRKHNSTHRAERRAYSREYYRTHKEEYLIRRKEWELKNKESRAAYQVKWRSENKERLREIRNRYQNERRRNNPQHKILDNLRSRIFYALRKSKSKKNCKSISLIGCTAKELKLYIESQFKPGMSWENYGRETWHIDHIWPVASFDLTDPIQRQTCFNYRNLQPLWAKENRAKAKKILYSPGERFVVAVKGKKAKEAED